ncbi:MAG: hypothetical protein Q4B59_02795 [Lachnospiraceae bacterium]|nr:hypothetical protein [Lachnospiraceae bacterium]
MKRSMKRVVTLLLAFVLSLSALTAVEAAQKKLKVTYKGKSATIINAKGNSLTYPSLKKLWGNPNKTEKYPEYKQIRYTYKRGKSFVRANYRTKGSGLPGYTSYTISIKDKNMSLNGVTVGMKKKDALKQLKRAFGSGKKSIDGEWVPIVQDYTKTRTIYVYYADMIPINVKYNKAGKVTSIYFWFS